MSIFVAQWPGFFHKFTGGDETRACSWSPEDLYAAFAEVCDLEAGVVPVQPLMLPGCTVQDLFDDPSDGFLNNYAVVMQALGAPAWCCEYAEDEAHLLHDCDGKGRFTVFLRAIPRPERWTDVHITDFMANMHINQRWTPSRSDLTALLWHMETMDMRQRKVCQPIMDTAVEETLALDYDGMCSGFVQSIVASALCKMEALGVLDHQCALKAFTVHAMTACLEECGDVALRHGTAEQYGSGRWEVLFGFRAYMKDHFWKPSLWSLIHEDGTVSSLVHAYMARLCSTLYGHDPVVLEQRVALRDAWIAVVDAQFYALYDSLDAAKLLPFL